MRLVKEKNECLEEGASQKQVANSQPVAQKLPRGWRLALVSIFGIVFVDTPNVFLFLRSGEDVNSTCFIPHI